MSKQFVRAAAHKASRAGALGVLFTVAAHAALAQGTPPAAPAASPASAADNAPSEAARRAAASPYRFILLNANAPARKPTTAPAAAPAPAPTPVTEVRRAAPAPAPVEQASLSRAAPAPAPLVVPPPSAIPPQPAPLQAAPAPAAAPAVATLNTKPPEPAPIREVRREIIPVSTPEPRLSAAQIRDGLNGVVRVQFDVNPDGSTGNVTVVQSSNRGLNRPTTDAIANWKFERVDETLTIQTELVYQGR